MYLDDSSSAANSGAVEVGQEGGIRSEDTKEAGEVWNAQFETT